MLLMTSGCGGGSGTTGATNAGPSRGTFTIVVTGATQGGSRNVSLSLTIQ
ncbi:MAG: hypothetical protein ACRD4K_00210 [Candidatus Acidiferrales bacterium]